MNRGETGKHRRREVEGALRLAAGLAVIGFLALMGIVDVGARGDGGTEEVRRIAAATGTALAVEAQETPISSIFMPSVQYWGQDIRRWAEEYQLDPNLVATVMQIESCGLPTAVSSAGAQGLFQVMPFHFDGDDDMQDPDTNVARGMAYLALGLERAGGNVELAMAGYNGGHSQIGKDSSLWPEETKRYVYWGSGIYAGDSGRLQEWLEAGGQSLCDRAAEELYLN